MKFPHTRLLVGVKFVPQSVLSSCRADSTNPPARLANRWMIVRPRTLQGMEFVQRLIQPVVSVVRGHPWGPRPYKHQLRDTCSAIAASRASPSGLFGPPLCAPADVTAYKSIALDSLVCPQGPEKDSLRSWWFQQRLLDPASRDALSSRRLRAHARCRYQGYRWKESLAHVLSHCPGKMDAIRDRLDDALKTIEST
ncbi:unnamed protein product [Peronospora belbahrii]|uniref:Reverse transcriptase zinc-binding domain-containing protein n=1 Tax=Peronospora belbahrii TaxID=622444 RepID=A0ABN8CZS6_9STRA|nr:unnamed protein product [Peronospora belbahrii]